MRLPSLSVGLLATWLAALWCSPTHAHRILGIFTHIGGSHYHTFYPIMNGLAERGHNVTVLSYFSAKNPSPNYHERRFDGVPIINSTVPLDRRPGRSLWHMYDEFFALYHLGDMMCRDTFRTAHFDDVLREHRRQPFDLVVTELFDSDCALGVVHLMGVPYVGLSSCVLMPWLHDRIAAPDVPSHVPMEFVGSSERMTYAERVTSWLMTKTLKLMYSHWTVPNDNRLLAERFGAGIPDVAELARNVSLVLSNTHFSLHGPRPFSPQLVEIGGVHIKAPKPMPAELQRLLDGSAEHGVILISWGSNIRASSLEEVRVRAILRALAQMPQQIVWKWENETLPGQPANVHIRAWLPQREILYHPNVRLFWSHGGNLGISEAAHCGTPVVVTPIYGDQFVNEAAAKNRGMAVSLPFDQIDEPNVLGALREGLRPAYKASAQRVSRAFRARPMSPVDTATWWIEHVIETDGFPLGRSYAVEMSWFTYHSVDAMLTLLAAGTALLWLTVRLAVCGVGALWGLCVGGGRSKKDGSKVKRK